MSCRRGAPRSTAETAAQRWRRRVVNEALRPAEETADWLHVIDDLRAEDPNAIAEALSGLSLVSARTEEEAATVAALLLREALETPERTAALVTPDQRIARRVTAPWPASSRARCSTRSTRWPCLGC